MQDTTTQCVYIHTRSIPCFIQSIDDDLKRTMEKQAASSSSGKVHSFCMFIASLGGLMAVSTDPPYCLVYPNIYSTTVPHEDRHHFNVQGGPPWLLTCACICHALLQHADLSEAHRQKYHGSHQVIPQGVQYSRLFPKITMPHNYWAPLVDLHTGKPCPLVLVEDCQLKGNIFPGMPGDSLLYHSDDLAKLRRLRFQVTTHRTEQTSAVEHKEEKSQSSHGSGEMPSSTGKNGEPSKSRGKSPWARHQRQPQTGSPHAATSVLPPFERMPWIL